MKYFRRNSMIEAWEFTDKVEDLPAEVQKLIQEGCLVSPGDMPGVEIRQPLLKGDIIFRHANSNIYWVRSRLNFHNEYLAYDDPELDCTPYEHPAFTRGSEWGGTSVIRIIREVMANPDQPHHYDSPELNALVRELQLRLNANK